MEFKDYYQTLGVPRDATAEEVRRAYRRAARAAIVEYEDLEPVLDVEEALRRQHFVLDSHTHRRGDAAAVPTA